MTTTVSKRSRRPPKQNNEEPVYLWLPVVLLQPEDQIVVNQQEVSVEDIDQQKGYWQVHLQHPTTRKQSTEWYRQHEFVYAKATESVKARLAGQSVGAKK